MGTKPAIAQELAKSVITDYVSKYLAAVLRVYKENAEQDERLSKTLSRIGFEIFKSKVKANLNIPFDDLIKEAKNARETAEQSTCIEHIKEQL
jgi:NAD(P)H-nitrite reductase large subunit